MSTPSMTAPARFGAGRWRRRDSATDHVEGGQQDAYAPDGGFRFLFSMAAF